MRTTLLALILLWATASVASAQVGQPVGPAPQPQPVGQPQPNAQPQPGPAPGPAGPAPGAPAPEETAQEGRGIEYGAHLLVPIALHEDLGVGIGGQLRVGWEFGGGLTVEINGGLMLISAADDSGFDVSGSVSDFWLGGGLRYAFLNPSALVPFIGAGIQLNFWTPCVTSGGTTVCADDTSVGLGLNALAGITYEIDPYIAIEAGLQANLALPGGDFPAESFVYLSPFLGGTLYY